VDAGVNFFDTAEIYGFGKSEQILGSQIKKDRDSFVLASKFFPLPWRLFPSTVIPALKRSLKRLGIESLDLYQVHWPYHLFSINSMMNSMARAVKEGLVKQVGVSNYSLKQTQTAHDALKAQGLGLASNQVEYSGLMDYCRDNGITLIAYSPLGMGTLTGKYTPENPPPAPRKRKYNPAFLARLSTLTGLLREVGAAHGDKTPAQAAINWTICKGTLPIPGAKNARQASDNAGALGWRLSDEEIAVLDQAADRIVSS
jgi:aryl-alcohol dehydrogenase-like predicted oxidoreductase